MGLSCIASMLGSATPDHIILIRGHLANKGGPNCISIHFSISKIPDLPPPLYATVLVPNNWSGPVEKEFLKLGLGTELLRSISQRKSFLLVSLVLGRKFLGTLSFLGSSYSFLWNESGKVGRIHYSFVKSLDVPPNLECHHPKPIPPHY